MAAHDPSLDGPPGPFGALLAQLRLRRGWSQLRLAEHLCAASGLPTVSRHEISRWERHERLPGDFWLGWLAAVLEASPDELAAAATASRRSAGPGAYRPIAGHEPPRGRATASGTGELLAMAHAWLAGGRDATRLVTGRARPGADEARSARPSRSGAAVRYPSGEPGGDLAERLAALRRLDDVLGGVDLAPVAALRLGSGVPPGSPGTARGRRALALAAEADQILGWTRADAGDTAGALAAYRQALAAAGAAGDRPLAAHVLGCASHLLVAPDPRSALLLARTATAGCRRCASATGRALLLHRTATAAAACGQRTAADEALRAARRAADQHDARRDPAWLYWLEPAELDAMAGRCLAAMGRPLRARRLLEPAVRRCGHPRTAALDRSWLAWVYIDLGEVEHACDLAAAALIDTVRSGSARAADQLERVHDRLRAHRELPAVRRYAAAAGAARPLLPSRARGASPRCRTGD
jgi:transcriptional regulator with XRE-family HTH domain